jgi:hypothetical protein
MPVSDIFKQILHILHAHFNLFGDDVSGGRGLDLIIAWPGNSYHCKCI